MCVCLCVCVLCVCDEMPMSCAHVLLKCCIFSIDLEVLFK